MCDPTLVIACASAMMQYQQSIKQQQYQWWQQQKQNELALRNLKFRRKAETLKLRQSSEKNLKKLELAEKLSRRKRATFKAKKTFTGNTFNTLLANYYDSISSYRNVVLGNIEKNVFQYGETQKALTNQYDAQSTYTVAPDYLYTAGASALSFAGSYYEYKARQNANDVNPDYYSYNFNPDGST